MTQFPALKKHKFPLAPIRNYLYICRDKRLSTMASNKHKQTTPAPSQPALLTDACLIIEQAQTSAYRAVNETLIMRNWLLGMRINTEIL